MTSCVGTSMVIVRRLTRTIRSIGQITQIRPGPLGTPINRPMRKITPRSYSRRTFSELKSQIKTIITAINTNGNCSMVVLCGTCACRIASLEAFLELAQSWYKDGLYDISELGREPCKPSWTHSSAKTKYDLFLNEITLSGWADVACRNTVHDRLV